MDELMYQGIYPVRGRLVKKKPDNQHNSKDTLYTIVSTSMKKKIPPPDRLFHTQTTNELKKLNQLKN